MLICSRCKINEVVYKLPNKNSGICRPCNTAKLKKYRSTAKGKAATQRAINNYLKKHPERKLAWNAVVAIPLQPCIRCGAEKAHRHHPDPLDKKNIVFLCPLHHKQIHKSLLAV